jgi:Zn finger protein HypA/HybF involved in hydrogenase expression
MTTQQTNTDHLCSVYCPNCGKVADKISWNLIKEAGKVTVICPFCKGVTFLEYDGNGVSVDHG